MIWEFLALSVLLGLVGWYAFEERGRRYEQILRMLETQRDEARQEAKVFRNLLFPVMAKAEAGASGDVGGTAAAGAATRPASNRPGASPKAPELPKTADEIWRMRIPYREKFKLLIEKQKPVQEKTHVNAS